MITVQSELDAGATETSESRAVDQPNIPPPAKVIPPQTELDFDDAVARAAVSHALAGLLTPTQENKSPHPPGTTGVTSRSFDRAAPPTTLLHSKSAHETRRSSHSPTAGSFTTFRSARFEPHMLTHHEHGGSGSSGGGGGAYREPTVPPVLLPQQQYTGDMVMGAGGYSDRTRPAAMHHHHVAGHHGGPMAVMPSPAGGSLSESLSQSMNDLLRDAQQMGPRQHHPHQQQQRPGGGAGDGPHGHGHGGSGGASASAAVPYGLFGAHRSSLIGGGNSNDRRQGPPFRSMSLEHNISGGRVGVSQHHGRSSYPSGQMPHPPGGPIVPGLTDTLGMASLHLHPPAAGGGGYHFQRHESLASRGKAGMLSLALPSYVAPSSVPYRPAPHVPPPSPPPPPPPPLGHLTDTTRLREEGGYGSGMQHHCMPSTGPDSRRGSLGVVGNSATVTPAAALHARLAPSTGSHPHTPPHHTLSQGGPVREAIVTTAASHWKHLQLDVHNSSLQGAPRGGTQTASPGERLPMYGVPPSPPAQQYSASSTPAPQQFNILSPSTYSVPPSPVAQQYGLPKSPNAQQYAHIQAPGTQQFNILPPSIPQQYSVLPSLSPRQQYSLQPNNQHYGALAAAAMGTQQQYTGPPATQQYTGPPATQQYAAPPATQQYTTVPPPTSPTASPTATFMLEAYHLPADVISVFSAYDGLLSASIRQAAQGDSVLCKLLKAETLALKAVLQVLLDVATGAVSEAHAVAQMSWPRGLVAAAASQQLKDQPFRTKALQIALQAVAYVVCLLSPPSGQRSELHTSAFQLLASLAAGDPQICALVLDQQRRLPPALPPADLVQLARLILEALLLNGGATIVQVDAIADTAAASTWRTVMAAPGSGGAAGGAATTHQAPSYPSSPSLASGGGGGSLDHAMVFSAEEAAAQRLLLNRCISEITAPSVEAAAAAAAQSLMFSRCLSTPASRPYQMFHVGSSRIAEAQDFGPSMTVSEEEPTEFVTQDVLCTLTTRSANQSLSGDGGGGSAAPFARRRSSASSGGGHSGALHAARMGSMAVAEHAFYPAYPTGSGGASSGFAMHLAHNDFPPGVGGLVVTGSGGGGIGVIGDNGSGSMGGLFGYSVGSAGGAGGVAYDAAPSPQEVALRDLLDLQRPAPLLSLGPLFQRPA